MSFLRSLFSGKKSGRDVSPEFTAPARPEQPLFVIGDVHGCSQLLGQLLTKQPVGSQLVFVGDLIDRGPNSAQVLDMVRSACGAGAICLAGNHEAMMMGFLDEPTRQGPRWLKYGGMQVLENLKIGGVSERSDETALVQGRDKLVDALGEDCIEWLRGLPRQWSSGNVHVVHAAADPNVSMSEQQDKVLMWGHHDFHIVNRSDDQWVVFGHTIQEEPSAVSGRIAVDTGAYATDRLTAAYIRDGEVSFISA